VAVKLNPFQAMLVIDEGSLISCPTFVFNQVAPSVELRSNPPEESDPAASHRDPSHFTFVRVFGTILTILAFDQAVIGFEEYFI